MTVQEQRLRQLLIKSTMKTLGISKKKAQKTIAELEEYGLILVTSNGKLAIKELGA